MYEMATADPSLPDHLMHSHACPSCTQKTFQTCQKCTSNHVWKVSPGGDSVPAVIQICRCQACRKCPSYIYIFCSSEIFISLLKPSEDTERATLGKNPSTAVSIVSKGEQREMINKINAIRRRVQPTATNMLKMKWSDSAADSAKQWAQQCNPVSSPDQMRIVDGTYCGESRLQATYVVPWSKVVDRWLAKKSNFRYGVGAIDPAKDIYGYTQIIWYNTHEIGCAIARCNNAEFTFYYVCRTCPAGNIQSHIATPYKDGPSCEDCPYECEDKLCTNPCNYKDKVKDCRNMLNLFDCGNNWMVENCRATCECTNSIV